MALPTPLSPCTAHPSELKIARWKEDSQLDLDSLRLEWSLGIERNSDVRELEADQMQIPQQGKTATTKPKVLIRNVRHGFRKQRQTGDCKNANAVPRWLWASRGAGGGGPLPEALGWAALMSGYPGPSSPDIPGAASWSGFLFNNPGPAPPPKLDPPDTPNTPPLTWRTKKKKHPKYQHAYSRLLVREKKYWKIIQNPNYRQKNNKKV